jgi:putative sigma-54 modulation protein
MNIIIKATDLKLTSPLKEYIEKKLGALEKFLPDLEENGGGLHARYEARVEIARTTRHHRHGIVYKAEVNLILKGGADFFRAETRSEDVRAAIDDVKDDLERQLRKFKGKKAAVYLRGARVTKRALKISRLAKFFRRERIRDEGL